MRRILLAASAAFLVAPLAGCGSDSPTYLEDIPGYRAARIHAEAHCALSGDVPASAGPYDPQMLACLDDQTRDRLVHAGHQDAATAPSRAKQP